MAQPVIRRLNTDPPPLPEPAADTGFGWFTPGRSAPAVPVALPHDAALLARGRVTLALVLEVLAGRRRIDQISSLISAPVARYLAAHRDLATGPRQVRLHSVRLCQPHEHAGEFAAVYYVGHAPTRLPPGSSGPRHSRPRACTTPRRGRRPDLDHDRTASGLTPND